MVGKACGVEGVVPGQYCEPRMTTVGSQDTTGPMTRDELKDLACLGFSLESRDAVFLSHGSVPKPVDVVTHHTSTLSVRFLFLDNDNFTTTIIKQVRVVVSP